MAINTKIRLTLLASVVALAAAAPSAFADYGTWQSGFHTDPGGTPDAPAARHSKQVMDKKIAPSSVAAVNTGSWLGSFHTDPGGTADAPAALHAKEVMAKQLTPGTLSYAASFIKGPAF